jgi:hypothetical protein
VRRSLASERGVSIVEVALMLTVSAALVAALMPTLAAVMRSARYAAAQSDMARIVVAITNFRNDTGLTTFTQDGLAAGLPMSFLYSDGDIPAAGSASTWRTPASGAANGFLEQHLVFNAFNGVFAYPTIGLTPWRGAYLDAPVDADPWGNRYAVNTLYLGPLSGNDVVVFTAGQDEEVDTTDAAAALTAVDDDVIVLVEA